MAKKSKKKKKKKLKKSAALFGSGAVAGVATEIIGDVLRHVVADALERYLVKGGGKKKLKKRLRKMAAGSTSQPES